MTAVLYENKHILHTIFQNLSDSNRLAIILFIDTDECSVSQIVEATRLSQPLVSHHLKMLRECGILETKRDGPFIYYRIKNKKLIGILVQLLEIIK